MQMLRNIPHWPLLPLVILWLGVDEQAKSVFWLASACCFRSYPQYVPWEFDPLTLVPPGDEPSVWANNWQALSRSNVAGGLAIDPGWYSLFAWSHVAHADRAETIASTSGIGYMAMNAREFMRTDIVV